jgi:hypothetical protein
VSFELDVPRTAILTLHTHNGGISLADFQGTANFHAVNGGVSLTNVGGDIRGETRNGGVTVDLSGDRWDGAGLDVETTNGGIQSPCRNITRRRSIPRPRTAASASIFR